MSNKPQLYIIAGPNGAGKTTWAETFLPEYAECAEFLNADMIAKGFSPFTPEKFAYTAGKMMLEQIGTYSKQKRDFAFETTLSGKAHASLLIKLKEYGYTVNMFYLWVPDVKLAMARIEERVRHGGHNIPKNVSTRRYSKSLYNLFNIYMPIVDNLWIYDNSIEPAELIFLKKGNNKLVKNSMKYVEITENWEK